MKDGYLPRRDAELNAWAANFSAKISAIGPSLGLLPPQITAYGLTQSDFSAKLAAAVAPATRTRVTIAQKDASRKALKSLTRLLVSIIEGQAGLTDAQRLDLGLTVRRRPTPIPAPTMAPAVDVVSVAGRTISLRIHDGSGSRAKPDGAAQAWIFSFSGENPPEEAAAWHFEAGASKTEAQITPADAVAGVRLWVRACWVNAKNEPGPMCGPVSTSVQLVAPPVAQAEVVGTLARAA